MAEKIERLDVIKETETDFSSCILCLESKLNDVIGVVNTLNTKLDDIVTRLARAEHTVSRLENTVRRECGRIA